MWETIEWRSIGRRFVRLDIRPLLMICTGISENHVSTDSRGQRKVLDNDILKQQRSFPIALFPAFSDHVSLIYNRG